MKFAACLLAVTLSLSVQPALADSPRVEKTDAGDILLDLFAVRPIGVVATVVGGALFVAQLPFDLIFWQDPAVPGEALVVRPGAYTFDRPLGEF